MAYASITYTSASGTTFALTNSEGDPIPYLRQADITVTVNGTVLTQGTGYTFNAAGTAVVLASAVSGATVIISRSTSIADATVVYTAGSTLTAQDLNNADNQIRYGLQEFSDTYAALTTGTGDLQALGGFIGSSETWVSDNAHAATTGAIDGRVDSKIDTALTTDVVAGNAITITDNSPSSGQITVAVTNGAIETAELADGAVTTAKIVDSNVTTVKIADSNVTTAKIADANVTTAKIADSAVTSAKIADGTIVAGDLAFDSVTSAKILDANVTTAKIADSNVTTAKLADSSVTSAKIADGTIVAGDLASDSVTTAKILDANVTTAKIADSNVTTGKIADSAVTAIKIADGVITSAKLNASTVVTAAEQSASTPDDTSFFTTSASDNRYDSRYVNVTGDTMSGALAMGNNKITGLGTPTANADAATKLYVDNSVAAGVGDADYGDITVSGTGTVWTIDNGAVTSAKIADGTIVNADVNASAAIAGTKISPDFGSQTVQTTGVISHALGTAGAPTVTFTGDTNTGIYSPGADQVAISTNGAGRLFVDADGDVGVGTASPGQLLEIKGANARFAVNSTTVNDGGILLQGNGTTYAEIKLDASSGILDIAEKQAAGNITFSTGTAPTERLRITQAGLVGIGSSSPVSALTVVGSAGSGDAGVQITSGSTTTGSKAALFFIPSTTPSFSTGSAIKSERLSPDGCDLQFFTVSSLGNSPVRAMTIDSSQRVGIGATTVGDLLHLRAATTPHLRIDHTTTSSFGAVQFYEDTTQQASVGALGSTSSGVGGGNALQIWNFLNAPTVFATNNQERARIDSSGRLLVGTSSNGGNYAGISPRLQIEGTTYDGSALSGFCNANDQLTSPLLLLGKSRGTSNGAVTAVQSGDRLGAIWFVGADGTDRNTGAASIEAFVDSTPGNDDMPGRLVFSTTADGASSPTERMRISQDGSVTVGLTPSTDSYFQVRTSQNITAYFDRTGNDGGVIAIRQDQVTEGTISVSGTTVTYGGGHLARWSQLPNDEDPSGILKGTVMSNLDEMCEWGEEDNEQLNKTKVSDVEGDPNVAGVFVSTSFDEDGPLDFFVGMTGDMIIRIAEGVTVQRGDLLMSAGDGTAKPQDDDIIRSKTIAKVTSTHVTCIYDDGSYCVPCVLMAC